MATPAYYALRNSAALLRDARPYGPPLVPSDASGARTLTLQTPRGTMYVVWDPHLAGATAWLPLAPGQRATCTDRLDLPTPVTSDCTALARDGLLAVTATSPRYVEVSP
jgi:hypothetical protein